jgi:hypothetical protein
MQQPTLVLTLVLTTLQSDEVHLYILGLGSGRVSFHNLVNSEVRERDGKAWVVDHACIDEEDFLLMFTPYYNLDLFGVNLILSVLMQRGF